MNREQKQKKIDAYDQAVSGAGYAILTEHGKMQVGAFEKMREDLHALGCGTMVVKNTLARIVFERHGIEDICEYLVGPSLLIYGEEEIAPAAKLLKKIGRTNQSIKVKGILFDGKVYPSTEFGSFSSMPTKQELRAKFAGVLKAPIAGFVRVINTPQRMAAVLGAYAAKREEN